LQQKKKISALQDNFDKQIRTTVEKMEIKKLNEKLNKLKNK